MREDPRERRRPEPARHDVNDTGAHDGYAWRYYGRDALPDEQDEQARESSRRKRRMARRIRMTSRSGSSPQDRGEPDAS